jgi:hypothetical protein
MPVTNSIGNNPTVPFKTLKNTLNYSVNTDAENIHQYMKGWFQNIFFLEQAFNCSLDVGGKIHFLFNQSPVFNHYLSRSGFSST